MAETIITSLRFTPNVDAFETKAVIGYLKTVRIP